MPLSRDEVIHGFRLILGRDPDSEEAIAGLMHAAGPDELGSLLLRSAEFRAIPRFKDILQVRPGAEPVRDYVRRASFRVLLIGNDQVATMAMLLQAMTGDVIADWSEATPEFMRRVASGEEDLTERLAAASVVYVQVADEFDAIMRDRYADHLFKIRRFPPLNYGGFHPDCARIRQADGTDLAGPMGPYHSSIAFWAWSQGWTAQQALDLFSADAYDVLEFDHHAKVNRKVLQGFGSLTGLPLDALLHRWDRSGVWMHTPDHPRLVALADLAAELLRREGIEPLVEAASYLEDPLARRPVWPVYPEFAARLGVQGSYLFKVDCAAGSEVRPHLFLSLEGLVTQSFECYARAAAGHLRCDRLRNGPYSRLAELRKSRRPANPRGWLNRLFGTTPEAEPETQPGLLDQVPHPEARLGAQQSWSTAVEAVDHRELDPVAGSVPFRIDPGSRIALAGGGFSRDLAAPLCGSRLRCLLVEAGRELEAADLERLPALLPSLGSVGSARQLVQLVERAYGRFMPLDTAWKRPDGRWVDAFRPLARVEGFASEAEVIAARDDFLAGVRRVFEAMDVFVLTLDTTEAWQRREEGAVLPQPPGVAAGVFDPARYELVKFDVAEVVQDLRSAFLRLRGVNPRVRFLLSVSPLPLDMTYEERHVLVSAVESQSILRAAIGEVVGADPDVGYFPALEIVSGPQAGGRYLTPDMRSITAEGLTHMLRLFERHYVNSWSREATGGMLPDRTPADVA